MEKLKINNLLDNIILNNEYKSLDYFINLLDSYFPLLNNLKDAEQDNIWHSEGNVYIHTQMVLNSLYDIIYAENDLSISDKKILILSAIFHDIGKILCNKEEIREGILRILSPNHEEKGANYISSILINSDLNYFEILTIINIVKYHQVPKMIVIKNKLDKKYFYDLASKCPLNLMYYLCISDINGRTCIDKQEQLDYLELFKIYAIEYSLFKPKEFNFMILEFSNKLKEKSINFKIKSFEDLNDYSIYHFLNENIYSEEEGIQKYLNIQNNSKVIVLSGISGSSKSYNSKFFPEDYNIINLDKIRTEICKSEDDQSKNPEVLRLAYEKLRENLRKKRNTVFDATNLRKDFRMKIFDLCDKYNSLTEIIFFESSINQSLKNIKQRERKISIDVLEKQVRDLQLPELFETRLRTKYINKINI